MKVKLLKFNKNAKIPHKAYAGDFCFDVYAVSEEEIAPNVWKYGFGFGLQIERDKEMIEEEFDVELFGKPIDLSTYVNMRKSRCPLSIDIRPRSSVWKTGMVLSNCTGTVDEGYCNEISVVFYHVFPHMERYHVGDRVAQLKIGMTFPIEFVEVDEFKNTDRGLNGYGSSGR